MNSPIVNQAAVEVLRSGTTTLRLSQAVVEVLRANTAEAAGATQPLAIIVS